jgi:hypothetical protein
MASERPFDDALPCDWLQLARTQSNTKTGDVRIEGLPLTWFSLKSFVPGCIVGFVHFLQFFRDHRSIAYRLLAPEKAGQDQVRSMVFCPIAPRDERGRGASHTTGRRSPPCV